MDETFLSWDWDFILDLNFICRELCSDLGAECFGPSLLRSFGPPIESQIDVKKWSSRTLHSEDCLLTLDPQTPSNGVNTNAFHAQSCMPKSGSPPRTVPLSSA